jgi:type II secretory pathway component PulC
MTKFKFNFSFLDRFKKNKNEAHDNENHERTGSHDVQFDESAYSPEPTEVQKSEFDSDETPEEFAEKTLGGLNINKYRQQLIDAASQSSEESDAAEDTSEAFAFQEMPSKPEAASKFKFKFPKFSSESARNKIRNSFSGKFSGKNAMGNLNQLDKFSWNDFVLRLFSPYTRGKIHSAFLILFVVTLTYMLGKNMALFFSTTSPVVKPPMRSAQIPLERQDTTLSDINKIASTNLFNAKQTDKGGDTAAKKDIDSIVCLDAEKKTDAQIKLLDTIVLQDSVKSVASVQVRGSADLMNVREGEKVDDMVEISKINRMRLILKNLQTGDCEYAVSDNEMEAPMPPLRIVSPKAGKSLFKSLNPNIKNNGNNFKIKRTYRDQLMNNMSDVLSQAKAVQITNPDGSLCFKMTEVVPGSIYSNLDIQENDIICNINGKKIENLNELMGLLGRIKDIDQFQIGLKRNGMTENKEYGFE